MTRRLYYEDGYLRVFRARIADAGADGRVVYLDRPAFYPASGGQPFDVGTLGGARVTDVIDEGERVAHVLDAPCGAAPGDEVDCEIDWSRRFDHMQQHSGQHLLSAAFVDVLGAATVSFHLGEAMSTIELALAALDAADAARVEDRANRIVFENRPVRVSFRDASGDLGLRKATERTGEVRIVEIDGFDRSACGGTHVRSTGEIGCVLLRRQEKIRGRVRIEFVCGLRAVRAAREDFAVLVETARVLASAPQTLAASATALKQRLEESEKVRRKLAAEAAGARGLRAWDETAPDTGGWRKRLVRVASLDEEVRAEAQAFTRRPAALFVALCEKPAAVLVAVSEASGATAAERLKRVLTELGGRGGGSTRIAQASLSDSSALGRAGELLIA